jgi:IS4 transposase
VKFTTGSQVLRARLCAVRKSPDAAESARRKLQRKSRHQKTIRPETLEYADFIVVITTLTAKEMTSTCVVEYYRGRWQVELAFKRLKSLLELGQVPKKKAASAQAWMQGKILVALLIERLLCEARFFSPWGYPLSREQSVADV